MVVEHRGVALEMESVDHVAYLSRKIEQPFECCIFIASFEHTHECCTRFWPGDFCQQASSLAEPAQSCDVVAPVLKKLALVATEHLCDRCSADVSRAVVACFSEIGFVVGDSQTFSMLEPPVLVTAFNIRRFELHHDAGSSRFAVAFEICLRLREEKE